MLIDGDAIPVTREELVIGQPVPWRVFDRDLRLLVKEGTPITSERQIEALLMRGAIRYETVEKGQRRRKPQETTLPRDAFRPRVPDTFRDYHAVAEELMGLYYRLEDEPDSLVEVVAAIPPLAARLQQMVGADPDKALVVIHLMHEYPYTIIHPIHVAIIVIILELSFKRGEAHQHSVVCAALTQNLSMNTLQRELFSQLFPLEEEQRRQIHGHPEASVELLRRAGVNDPLWLETVRQHHEREDGAGYPRGLKEGEILTEAKMLALADRYSAMVYDRPFREVHGPRAILKSYFDESQQEKRTLPLFFIKQMGTYPPGLFVRLQNGETALVVRRSGPSGKPMVVSYINPRGGSFDPPLLRDTGASPHHAIKAVCSADTLFFDLDVVWSALEKVRASE